MIKADGSRHDDEVGPCGVSVPIDGMPDQVEQEHADPDDGARGRGFPGRGRLVRSRVGVAGSLGPTPKFKRVDERLDPIRAAI